MDMRHFIDYSPDFAAPSIAFFGLPYTRALLHVAF